MITLDLPPSIEQMIVEQSKQQGVSVENYITSLLPSYENHPDTITAIMDARSGNLTTYSDVNALMDSVL